MTAQRSYLTIFSLIAVFLLFNTSIIFAENNLITLKDGSQINGKVISLQNKIYVIQTPFGQLRIPESQVSVIAAQNSSSSASSANIYNGTQPPVAQNPFGGQQLPAQSNYQSQVNAVQQKIMADPSIFLDIQTLAQDQDILKLLNDQALLNDILNYNLDGLEHNPKIQALMNNPKIQNLINRIGPQLRQSPSGQSAR